MEKQVLTIDQCKELVALGLDMSDASMSWTIPPCLHIGGNIGDIPTYTLQDILERLPNYSLCHYTTKVDSLDGFTLTVKNGEPGLKFGKTIHQEKSLNLLYAAFNMLKWCKINKYI